MMKIGVTGGIGSGKTSVCRVFSVLGIPVFSADQAAKEIMDTDPVIKSHIISNTGTSLYADGKLDRAKLANLIFNDQSLLQKVNLLIHPAVFNRFEKWTKEQTAPYVIMEAAILFESGAASLVDRIVTVVAPVEERIDRVTRRNKLSREDVMDRIKNQMEDENRLKLSHYIVQNSENDMIIPAILKIHEDILRNLKTEIHK
jgi:dephospho-CoA kinase